MVPGIWIFSHNGALSPRLKRGSCEDKPSRIGVCDSHLRRSPRRATAWKRGTEAARTTLGEGETRD